MKIIVSKEGFYLASLQDGAEVITGGTVEINGKSFSVSPAEVKEIPEGAKDCQYVLKDGALIENPEYKEETSEVKALARIVLELQESIKSMKSDLDVLKKADK